LDIPLSFSSIIVFVLTLGVGYIILLWAYSNAGRLQEWYDRDAFDKSLQTLVIGGTVTLASLIFLNAPLSTLISETSDLSTAWWLWLWNNLGAMLVVESLLIYVVQFTIQSYLGRTIETVVEYAT
jgi:hypothetical protein